MMHSFKGLKTQLFTQFTLQPDRPWERILKSTYPNLIFHLNLDFMLGSDLLRMGGPPYYPETSFPSSTTSFSRETGVHLTESEACCRSPDLETGGGQDTDTTHKNREEMLLDNYRRSPGRHDDGFRQSQGSVPERVNKDGEGFLFF